VVTKFTFNSLFSQAWLQSVTPANVIVGFKICCLYPLNRSAIKVIPLYSETSTNSTKPSCTGDNHGVSGQNCFTVEQHLYERCLSKGFDLHSNDLDYVE